MRPIIKRVLKEGHKRKEEDYRMRVDMSCLSMGIECGCRGWARNEGA